MFHKKMDDYLSDVSDVENSDAEDKIKKVLISFIMSMPLRHIEIWCTVGLQVGFTNS